jgi:hypothetical protein
MAFDNQIVEQERYTSYLLLKDSRMLRLLDAAGNRSNY